MMVNDYDDARLMLALQIDHTRVAGYLAAHWGNDAFDQPQPYVSMVLAAQEHDSGWWEWELKPTLTEDGYPHDYIGSVRHLGEHVWLTMYRNGINRLTEQDPYAGLIVQLHSEGLLTQGRGLLPYMPDFSQVPGVPEYLEESAVFRAKLVEELLETDLAPYVTDEVLARNFKYMEVFDQFGQFICNRYPLNSTHRENGPSATLSDTPVPVRAGVEDAGIKIDIQDERRAIVAPYPFDVDPLLISYPARLVPRRRYVDHADFLGEFFRGERIIVTYEMSSGEMSSGS